MQKPNDAAPAQITADPEPKKPLTPAAERALAEAAERRQAREAAAKAAAEQKAEFGGQAGPDPVRYGDWEKGGIISDF
jgi:hypothetical protein